MMSANKKKHPVKKGLSDKELIEKYEAGSINISEAVQKMLDKPSKASTKTEKQIKKRE